tara:strand:+ start:47658 stop:49445 length:1788 start_codon:yes stop_codon:yes gene_type:complete
MAIEADGFYDRFMSASDLKRQLEKSQIEVEGLLQQIESLRERNNKLSENNSLAPKRIALLEERLRDSKILLAKAAKENDRLIVALNETRNQVAALKVEVDKLSQPPIGYGTFLKSNDDGTVDVESTGKKLRVNLHPDINIANLREGDEVALNESLNVVLHRNNGNLGEIVTLIEVLPDGNRVLVKGRADQEMVMTLASEISADTLKLGASLLTASKSNMIVEIVTNPENQKHLIYEVPNVTFNDIGGLDDKIELIRDAVELPFLHPDLFAEYKLPTPRGILLYGPPGCGKTLIAKAIANSLAKKATADAETESTKSYFFNIKGPELLNKYVGETERQIRAIFEEARDKSKDGYPVIIFFDEMESLYRIRGSGISSDMESTIVPQLLAELDGVEELNNVIVIGASNREDLIDPAILRPGRLDIKIRIDRPNHDSAIAIFSQFMNADLPISATCTEDFGGGDIDKAIRVLIEKAVDEMYAAEERNEFLEVTYQNGDKQIMYFKDFASGAMIENIVRRAKKHAIKRFIEIGQKGLNFDDMLRSIREEFAENEDLPNTTNPDDWAKISGKKGERISMIRPLMNPDVTPESTQTISGQYL